MSPDQWLVMQERNGAVISPELTREPLSELEALMTSIPGFPPSESYWSRMAQMDLLFDAMRRLTDEELYLVEAYFYEGLSFRQIGRRMGYGVPPNWGKSTAERKVKKAVEAMRRHIGQEGVDEAGDGRSATIQDAGSFSEDGDGEAHE